MAPTLMLGLIAAIPIVLILLLRSNAAIVFLSLCAGYVLVVFAGSDVSSAAGRSVAQPNSGDFARIALLVVPALLSLWFMRKTVSPTKFLINIIVSVAVAAALVIFLVPLLPGGVRFDIIHNSIWSQTSRYQAAILGAGTAVAIIGLWLTNRHKSEGKHKKKH